MVQGCTRESSLPRTFLLGPPPSERASLKRGAALALSQLRNVSDPMWPLLRVCPLWPFVAAVGAFAQSGECNYPMPRPNLARPHARMIRTRGAKSRVDCMRYCNAAAVETNTRVTLPRECSLGLPGHRLLVRIIRMVVGPGPAISRPALGSRVPAIARGL